MKARFTYGDTVLVRPSVSDAGLAERLASVVGVDEWTDETGDVHIDYLVEFGDGSTAQVDEHRVDAPPESDMR